jgi:RNA polymerase sigma-70 factor (ECF subfamily)
MTPEIKWRSDRVTPIMYELDTFEGSSYRSVSSHIDMNAFDQSTDTVELLAAIERGDDDALDTLLANHRDYLKRIVNNRIEPDLRVRLDPSDVVQETMMVASQRIDDYLARRPTSFRVWLRGKAIERLINERNRHQALKRDVRKEVALHDVSSMAIAKHLQLERASQVAIRQEVLQGVHAAMQQLSASDRDILVMRHAEELTNNEAAEVMEISPDAASKRYGRAVARLSTELAKFGRE